MSRGGIWLARAQLIVMIGLWTAPGLAASALADSPEEFLPLAVGNCWTYEHSFWDATGSFPAVEERRVVTVTITAAERYAGETYYVFSLAPYDWPPVPSMFLAGKKVRFTADGRLVESTPAGERYVFRFDDTTESSYEIPEYDGATLVRRRREQREPAVLEYFDLVAYLAVGGEARAARFLESFGLLSCDAGLSVEDTVLRINSMYATRAVIGGRDLAPSELLQPTAVKKASWATVRRHMGR